MGWPSLSDIGNSVSNGWRATRDAVSDTASSAASTVSSAASTVSSAASSAASTVSRTATAVSSAASDLGSAARDRAVDLGRAGLDLGRRGVEAVQNFDVREAAATAREGIAKGTEAARDGVTTATNWSAERVGDAADWARSNVDGDGLASQAFRGAVTAVESNTRFGLGVTGGITREVVSTVGAAGQLTVTAAEIQASPEAAREYGTAIANTVGDAGRATGDYLSSVADDPSRLTGDAKGAWDVTSSFVGDTADRYGQAIREGRTEEIGMDVGTVATYVVPVGGGPVRGALTATARGATEVAVREGGEALVRTAASAIGREGGEAAVRTTTEVATTRTATTLATREGGEALVRGDAAAARTEGLASASQGTGRELVLYRDAATGERRIAGIADGPPTASPATSPGATSATAAIDAAVRPIESGRGVFFVDDTILPYIDKADATLGQPGSHFFMPLEDSALVTDAASAYRYTGGAPSLERAYTGNGQVFGVEFPLQGMTPRVPTAADSGGFAHYLEGGNTALRLGDGSGFLVNPTREFVVPGGGAMPEGSTLFRLAEDGSRVPMRTW